MGNYLFYQKKKGKMINPYIISHKIKLFWVNIFTKWVQSKNQNIQEMKIKTKETEDKIHVKCSYVIHQPIEKINISFKHTNTCTKFTEV
jgi:hypothetical protein